MSPLSVGKVMCANKFREGVMYGIYGIIKLKTRGDKSGSDLTVDIEKSLRLQESKYE
jgi:hypothetical protein